MVVSIENSAWGGSANLFSNLSLNSSMLCIYMKGTKRDSIQVEKQGGYIGSSPLLLLLSIQGLIIHFWAIRVESRKANLPKVLASHFIVVYIPLLLRAYYSVCHLFTTTTTTTTTKQKNKKTKTKFLFESAALLGDSNGLYSSQLLPVFFFSLSSFVSLLFVKTIFESLLLLLEKIL